MHLRSPLLSAGVPLLFTLAMSCVDSPPAPAPESPSAEPTAPASDSDSNSVAAESPAAEAPVRAAPEKPEAAPAPPPAEQRAFAQLEAEVHAAQALDAQALRDRYLPRLHGKLSYDPNAAQFLDRIQASRLALSDGERAALAENGFVVSARREFPSFLLGLAAIYSEHLPLYVSADALLDAIHSSYQLILDLFERRVMIPELRALLSGMLARLPAAEASDTARADMDLYLSVAAGLLDGGTPQPSAGASAADIAQLIGAVEAASGTQTVRLFGVDRDEDLSQFQPRGHYTANAELQSYFRAMTWLGRVDFRLIETLADGSSVFRRAQYDCMLLVQQLMGADAARFERIDAIVRTLVGESDDMTLSQLAQLVADLGGAAAARVASDKAVSDAMLAGGYGAQQIASYLINGDELPAALPLNRSFALFGQRYVVDSHVLSEAVHDRVKGRMLPSTLDAAFAALGNGQALAYEADLQRFPQLPGALARMRTLIDAHDDSFWGASMYNLWLRAIRALSPATDLSDPGAAGLPELAGSEAWGRRILSTQLAAWAELRHDTQLYAKPSYSAGLFCEYPDAYVDPYPGVYRALHDYALRGLALVDLVSDLPNFPIVVPNYFHELARVSELLGAMAERELRGEPFSAEQLAFINEAVELEPGGCAPGNTVPSGWYARLFVMQGSSLLFDPVIADVHTQPTDEAGAPAGNILHVGTGYPRLMVTTVDTCMGPRAYTGVVYAYHELTTRDFERLTDAQWAQRFQQGERPADPAWLQPVLAR